MTAPPFSLYKREDITSICGYLLNKEEALTHDAASERGPRGCREAACWWVEGLICAGHLASPLPAFLPLAQGTVLEHSTANVDKIEHNITPKPFSLMCFHLLSLNELEHILHYFLGIQLS